MSDELALRDLVWLFVLVVGVRNWLRVWVTLFSCFFWLVLDLFWNSNPGGGDGDGDLVVLFVTAVGELLAELAEVDEFDAELAELDDDEK